MRYDHTSDCLVLEPETKNFGNFVDDHFYSRYFREVTGLLDIDLTSDLANMEAYKKKFGEIASLIPSLDLKVSHQMDGKVILASMLRHKNQMEVYFNRYQLAARLGLAENITKVYMESDLELAIPYRSREGGALQIEKETASTAWLVKCAARPL